MIKFKVYFKLYIQYKYWLNKIFVLVNTDTLVQTKVASERLVACNR